MGMHVVRFCSFILLYFVAAVLTNAQSLSQDGGLDVVKTYLLKQNHESALLSLGALPADTSAAFNRTRILYTAMANYGIGRFDSARVYFQAALHPMDSVGLNALDSLFERSSERSNPSPVVAIAMSAIVPGAGQCYAGRPLDGLNSFGLLAGLTGVSVLAPGLCYLTVPMFGRYYLGGIQHAAEQAVSKRAARQNRQLKAILALYDVSDDLINTLEVSPTPSINYFEYIGGNGVLDKGLGVALAGYKQFVSSQDGDVCVFEPSCSNYMVSALRQEGLVVGYLDGIDRLMRCRPVKDQGTVDPLVNCSELEPKSGKSPWLAAVSSGVIPGMGKVYTGEWKDGLYACVIVTAFSWLAYRSVQKASVPYTAFYGSMALSFYLGNIYGSWKSALRR